MNDDSGVKPFPSSKLTVELRESIAGFICKLLANTATQPAAGELLAMVVKEFGWPARHELFFVIQRLRDDSRLESYQRAYLKTALNDEEITDALRGEARWTHEDHAAFDELFRRSAVYRNSEAFRDMIEFTARFRDYAPFNNLLVRVQNPSCNFYATANDWRNRFYRCIKQDARPMLILAPRHPVMLVYDLDSTEPDPACPKKAALPEQMEAFTSVVGEWKSAMLETLLANANRDLIQVAFKELSSTNSGRAMHVPQGSGWKMRTVIHNELNERGRFATLCHELAHIYLGHLGGDKDGWWPSRINLNHSTVEIEAEATAYITCLRIGLTPASEAYVCNFLKSDTVPETVSLEMITKVAGKLEEMTRHIQPP
ncbi:MAG: hypothetical protein NTY01_03495, partial [Verrucomicrobia bacterium]|nr:hypothetical protein [Verrucomicrobiota bacterium]